MPAYCITVDARKAMTQRASMIHFTIDFERPYKDIVHQRHDWVMENWLHWTETFSVLVLQPIKQGQMFCDVLHDPRVLWLKYSSIYKIAVVWSNRCLDLRIVTTIYT